jgi:hypothetical protein
MSGPADDSAYVMEIAPVATPANLVTVLGDNGYTEQTIRDIIVANGAQVLYFGWSFQTSTLGGLAHIHVVVLFGGVADVPLIRRLDEVAATIRLAIDEGGTMVVCSLQRLDPSSGFGPYEPANVP